MIPPSLTVQDIARDRPLWVEPGHFGFDPNGGIPDHHTPDILNLATARNDHDA